MQLKPLPAKPGAKSHGLFSSWTFTGSEPGDGLFNPGGSISNLYAVQVAKHFYFPQTKTEGLFNMPKIVLFASEHV